MGICKGDTLQVSSSFLRILLLYKKKNKDFSFQNFLKFLKKFIGNEGTILLPAFNWDFCKKIPFDANTTLSQTGALSNYALKDKEFVRTKNPIYSFLVYGKNSNYIKSLKHFSCFNTNSPFGYLLENNGKILFIDVDYKKALTLVHVAEEEVNVEYRYFKLFSGKIKKNNLFNNSTYKMFVRDISDKRNTKISTKLDDLLKKKNAISKQSIDGINFTVINSKVCYEIMKNDLINNRKIVNFF